MSNASHDALGRRAVLRLLSVAAPSALTGACTSTPEQAAELTVRAFFKDAHGLDLTADEVQMVVGWVKDLPKLRPPAATQPSLGLDVDAD